MKKMANKTIKCADCRNKCDLKGTIYKIKHKGRVYCFCSEACKNKFQKSHFGGILY